MSELIKTGVAYHGNRMPSHFREDVKEMVDADLDIVVHMFSHIDWERHSRIIGDMIAISEDAGLEVWVDNWGIGGAPGDTSHFLIQHPDARMMYGNGQYHPRQICLNSPEYRQFVKNWLDAVVSIGGKTVFWDEPHLPAKSFGGKMEFCCTCPRCKKLFEEKYNKPLTEELTADLKGEFADFRTDSIVDYFTEILNYSESLGLRNTACIMPGPYHGITLDSVGKLLSIPQLESIGYDPYWYGGSVNPYEYVYNGSKDAIALADAYGKDHNIWIQGYNAPRGREEEIILATEAAYDAGAKTILSWSFHAGESNDYRSENPMRSWYATVEGMRRIRSMERDRLLAENRAKYMK
jgi:hypothetical protein